MRPGLIAIGSSLAVVGAAIIVSVLTPAYTPTNAQSSSREVDGLSAGSLRQFELPQNPSDPITVNVAWYAFAATPGAIAHVNVSLYAAFYCSSSPGPCPSTPALATWNWTSSGRWSGPGDAGPMYLLYVDTPDTVNGSVNFTASFQEVYRASSLPMPLLPLTITIVGGGILFGIGGMGIYLGLFLPSGVYRAREGEGRDAPESVDGPDGPDGPGTIDRPDGPDER